MVIMQIIKAIYNFFGEMRRARAAATLARSGDYKGAHNLMLTEFKGWI